MANISSSNSLGENVPKLRFPGTKGNFFTDYTHNTVRGLFTRITQRNTEGITNVITNSAEHGLIPHRDFFDKSIAVDGNISNYYVIKSGDFVYNPRKSNQAPYGPFNCYNYMDEGIVSPLYTCLRPKMKEYTEFLLWYFKSPVWHSYIYHNGAQGGARHDRVGMTTELMDGIPINLPCISEQQKIVSFLNLIERKAAIQSKLVDLLKLYKRGLLSKLFLQKGESVPQYRFTGFTDAWEQRKVTELGDIYIGLVTTMTAHYTDHGALLIRNSDIKDGKFEFDTEPIYLDDEFAEANKSRMHKVGDVITVHTGDVGTSAVITENEANSIGFATIVTRPNKEILDSYYLSTFLNTDKHKNWAVQMSTGDGQTNYNLREYTELIVPVPAIDEQKKIAAYITDLNNLITLHQQM